MNSTLVSQPEQEKLIKKLEVFKIQGTDKRGRHILRVVGKHFPARLVSVDTVKKYLEDEIYPSLNGRPFSVVYVHTDVNKADNFAGISALKSIYDAVPAAVRDNLDTFYFLHPGIQSRLFLATFGRLFFTGLNCKLKYVSRLEFLWDRVRRNGMEMPEFVHEFDEEMEARPSAMDYGPESDHPRILPVFDSTVSTYSMRCIA